MERMHSALGMLLDEMTLEPDQDNGQESEHYLDGTPKGQLS